MKRYDRLSQLNVKKPCSANWDEMQGDEAKRFCGHCRKHVHNLSEMPADEAEALLNSGSVCVRYRRDDRGRVITKNALIASAALLAAGCTPDTALTGDVAEPKPGIEKPMVGEMVAPTPPPEVQGKIAPVDPPKPKEDILMGAMPLLPTTELGVADAPDDRGDVQIKSKGK